MATEIERVNSDWHLDPRRWAPALYGDTVGFSQINQSKVAGSRTAGGNRLQAEMLQYSKKVDRAFQLYEVPNMLRTCADYLAKIIKQIARHRKSHPKETKVKLGICLLLEQVHGMTGGNRYDADAATIIEAAYMAAGMKRDISLEYLRTLARSKTFHSANSAK